MSEREYVLTCPNGHRHYVRLRTATPERHGRCPTCGRPAPLGQLPDVPGMTPRPPAERWTLADTRTMRRTTIVTFPSRESAERSLADVWRNYNRGYRPDLADSLPHTAAVPVSEIMAKKSSREG